jgi:hypothetical protein
MCAEFRTRTRELDDRVPVYREKTEWSVDYSGEHYYDWCTKTVTSSASFGGFGTYGTERMEDWVVSNYKTRSARGEVFNNPCEKEITHYIDEPIYRTANIWREIPVQAVSNPEEYNPPIPFARQGIQFKGFYPGAQYLGPPEHTGTFSCALPSVRSMSALEDLAVTRAYANIDTSEVASLVTAGEFRESVEFITDTMLRALKIFRAIRKKNLKALRKEISQKELASRYLEYRYALRPMISDIRSYYDAITMATRSVRQTYRGFEKETNTTHSSEVQVYSGDYGKMFARETCTLTRIARAGVLCSLDIENLDKWGFTKPLDAAWDLVPFSFIADWFFNIGHTIASFTPEQGVTELASWSTTSETIRREKWISRVTEEDSAYYGPYLCDNVTHTVNGGRVISEVTTYKRTPQPTRALLPTFKLNINKWKVLDIGLIVKQLAAGCDYKHCK